MSVSDNEVHQAEVAKNQAAAELAKAQAAVATPKTEPQPLAIDPDALEAALRRNLLGGAA